MNELKPCPFCGGEAEITKDRIRGNQGDYYVYSVACNFCPARIGGMNMSQEEAKEKWNRRADQ